MIRINDIFSIIKGCDNPLSSDCGVVELDKTLYVFDVGANSNIIEELNNIDLEKIIIISHFHQDHITNLDKIHYSKLYVGDNTYKYTNKGEIVKDKLILNECISIFPITCSHSKVIR